MDWLALYGLMFLLTSATGVPAAINTLRLMPEFRELGIPLRFADVWVEVVFLIGWPVVGLATAWRLVVSA